MPTQGEKTLEYGVPSYICLIAINSLPIKHYKPNSVVYVASSNLTNMKAHIQTESDSTIWERKQIIIRYWTNVSYAHTRHS